MKRAVIGILIGAGLATLACWNFSTPEEAFAQNGFGNGPSHGLVALTAQTPDGRQMLTVVDPAQRVIAVYHVDPSNGELALRSVRNIQWDLRMVQFNGATPLPQEIRSLLEQN
jgi:hypothetical protein